MILLISSRVYFDLVMCRYYSSMEILDANHEEESSTCLSHLQSLSYLVQSHIFKDFFLILEEEPYSLRWIREYVMWLEH